jgi:hypothetical protein
MISGFHQRWRSLSNRAKQISTVVSRTWKSFRRTLLASEFSSHWNRRLTTDDWRLEELSRLNGSNEALGRSTSKMVILTLLSIIGSEMWFYQNRSRDHNGSTDRGLNQRSTQATSNPVTYNSYWVTWKQEIQRHVHGERLKSIYAFSLTIKSARWVTTRRCPTLRPTSTGNCQYTLLHSSTHQNACHQTQLNIDRTTTEVPYTATRRGVEKITENRVVSSQADLIKRTNGILETWKTRWVNAGLRSGIAWGRGEWLYAMQKMWTISIWQRSPAAL